MNFKVKIDSIKKHPAIIKYIVLGKSRDEIESKVRELDKKQFEMQSLKEVNAFISSLKKNPVQYNEINVNNNPKLNRLCSIEDWQNGDIKKIILELQHASKDDYINKVGWEMKTSIVNSRKQGLIHRKDWEWALGVMAMERFGKLKKDNVAIGIGAGREEILFYLANKVSRVYATDLYDGKGWKNFAPTDFLRDPKKYAPFPYDEDALTVLRMDGSKLDFPDETFDIAFSFSSIEHFGGENHSGALKAMREIERVLKPGGIAIITTEYILNDKEHPEFFNKKTIYSDLIDKLDKLKPVEPLDLRITTNTLDKVIDYESAVYWDKSLNNDEFKRNNPLLLVRVEGMLITSIMIVFQKQQ